MASTSVKRQNAIIWLERSGLSLITKEKPTLLRLSFTPDVIDHMEVIDEAKLQNLIHIFVTQNKLGPLSVSIVLAPDVLFEKEWILPQTVDQTLEEQQFLDSIPFEYLIQRTWIKDNKKKLAVVNGNFLVLLKQCFEKEGWLLTTVAPYFVVYGPTWNDQIAKDALKKIDGMRHDNMLEKQISREQKSAGTESNQDSHNRSLLPILIVVFSVLMLILAVLLIKNAIH